MGAAAVTVSTAPDLASETSAPMLRALTLARSVLGSTSPNPAVGAVLVRHGAIVGEGATQPPGGPHAEAVAIRAAGSQARGATLYVTLEPCSTRGRTPPCVDALRNAGIREIVVASGDPDPRVNGDGIARLRAAGLAVRLGDGAPEARRHYEAYSHHRRTGRPFVIAKFAASLDGKIAAVSGDSRWVSGPETRAWAHAQRATVDAILVGVSTVLIDDPALTARPDGRAGGAPQPLRVVLDSTGRTPLTARLLRDQDIAQTLLLTTAAAPSDWRTRIEAAGATVREIPAEGGRVALEPALETLAGEFGVVSLLVEGGGVVHGALFDRGLVDKVQAVIAPVIIGGAAAGAVAGGGAQRMTDAFRLHQVAVERLGSDVLISGYPHRSRPLQEVTVRPAGLADCDAVLALIDDPAQRDLLQPAVAAAFARLENNAGNVWIAHHGEATVGAVALAYCWPDDPVRADGAATAAIVRLAVSRDWRNEPLAGRLLDVAEASASGRGFRWLTLELEPSTDATAISRADWTARGYRYFRHSRRATPLLIKELGAPAPADADNAADAASPG